MHGYTRIFSEYYGPQFHDSRVDGAFLEEIVLTRNSILLCRSIPPMVKVDAEKLYHALSAVDTFMAWFNADLKNAESDRQRTHRPLRARATLCAARI
ncbi:hypothetical protein [Burkholderia glumae]|uniref:hypothetical protein n=1 Tax=Burkholderia glumae TaxID=337 RepID=UPI002036B1B2|nr:hypothetical protein [Burkholderia glumae]MCM2496144.1 hypothetical protein [Burkholderia glumae]